MDDQVLQELNRLRHRRQAAILVTNTTSGTSRVVSEVDVPSQTLGPQMKHRFLTGRSGMLEDGVTFLTVCVPPPRLVLIGAVHISQALAPMAEIVGFDVRIIDPRTAFASKERFPNVDLVADWPKDALNATPLDTFTGLVALTHDPKIDDDPLAAALEANCFYIGALGSRRTHASRVERLRGRGLNDAELRRIHAPIGLDIAAQSPAEIAVAILAEMVAALRSERLQEVAA